MGKPPRRVQQAADAASLTPPAALSPHHHIAQVVKAAGNSLFEVQYPDTSIKLAEMLPRFRNTLWVKRGSYVVVDGEALAERGNKLAGSIVNVIRDEREWRKQTYWPKEFPKTGDVYEDNGEEEASRVGQLPPSDSDDEDLGAKA